MAFSVSLMIPVMPSMNSFSIMLPELFLMGKEVLCQRSGRDGRPMECLSDVWIQGLTRWRALGWTYPRLAFHVGHSSWKPPWWSAASARSLAAGYCCFHCAAFWLRVAGRSGLTQRKVTYNGLASIVSHDAEWLIINDFANLSINSNPFNKRI